MNAAVILRGCGITLDRDLRLVLTDEGRPVHLTNPEMAVLEALMERRSVITNDALIMRIYADRDEPDSAVSVLKVTVGSLRRKLRDAGAPDVVRVVWGVGYVCAAWGSGRPHRPPTPGQGRKRRRTAA